MECFQNYEILTIFRVKINSMDDRLYKTKGLSISLIDNTTNWLSWLEEFATIYTYA